MASIGDIANLLSSVNLSQDALRILTFAAKSMILE